jgi:hypothetical protein
MQSYELECERNLEPAEGAQCYALKGLESVR